MSFPYIESNCKDYKIFNPTTSLSEFVKWIFTKGFDSSSNLLVKSKTKYKLDKTTV